MPTILIIKGYRFFFYSNEHRPRHIHIEKDNKTAKFNLEPVELIKSSGMNSKELKEIRKLVEKNLKQLESKWDEYFNNN